jgi:multifunctional beta-oxidation protein
VLVANAGVIRDKSFQGMTEQDWDLVLAVHLRYSLVIFSFVWNTIYSPLFKEGHTR